MNPYYTPTGNPPSQQRALSAAVRAEYILVSSGFDAVKAAIDAIAASNLNASLPDQTANAGRPLISDSLNAVWGQSIYFDEVNQRVGIGTSFPTSRLTISDNSQPLPTPLSGTELHVSTENGNTTRVLLDAFASPAGVSVRRANGTASVPSAVLVNNSIGYFGAYGYGGSSYSQTYGGSIGWFASQNWTDSAQGTSSVWQVTPNGTNVPINAVTLNNDGSVTILSATLTLNGNAVETVSHAASTFVTQATYNANNTSISATYATGASVSAGFAFYNNANAATYATLAQFSSTNAVLNNITSGTYTPSVAGLVNVVGGSLLARPCQWTRNGSMVTVSGSVGFTASAAAATTGVSVTLPVAPNAFTASTDANGVGAAGYGGLAFQSQSVSIFSSAGTQTVLMAFNANSASSYSLNFVFTYRIS